MNRTIGGRSEIHIVASPKKISLLGCVLAGGHSSRMGRDKALIRPFGPNGPTMLEHTFGLLQKLCGECVVTTSAGRAYPHFPCMFDEKPDLGPISGIMGALVEARKKACAGIFALACDLPLMRLEILERLAARQPGESCGIFFINPPDGKIQMLAGIYMQNALPCLQKGIAGGKFGLYSDLAREDLSLVPYDKSDAPVFFNCNSAEDLAYLSSLS